MIIAEKVKERLDEMKTTSKEQKGKNEKTFLKDEAQLFIRADSQYCLKMYDKLPPPKK